MSISKGGQNVKPYVGSKEVQEAYVGSQKVYSAAPPIYYGFLGAENDYVIAPWCKLGAGSTIVKNDNIYRISLSKVDAASSRITISEIHGNKFRFIAKLSDRTSFMRISFVVNGKANTQDIGGLNTSNYTLKSYDVPAGTTQISLFGGGRYDDMVIGYCDEIRFENE